MELKKYFGRFGIAWIIAGLIFSGLLSVFQLIDLSTNENVIVNATMLSFWLPRIIGTSILFGFVPFLFGFFGLIKLFKLTIIWEILYAFAVFLSQVTSPQGVGAMPPYPLILLLPLVLIVGIVWEIIHYYRNKKAAKSDI